MMSFACPEITLNPARVLLAGDLHGFAGGVEFVSVQADRNDCPLILQAGDFGYWPHTDPKFLAKADKILGRREQMLFWVDGNHEAFEWLFNREHERDEHGLVVIGERIRYIPRGHRFRLNGIEILGLGGAVSADKQWRLDSEKKRKKTHQRSRWYWWHEEALRPEDVERALTGGRCDILLCHDAPDGIDLRGICELDYDGADLATGINRKLLRDVVMATRPALIVHGHYHEAHTRPFYHPAGVVIPVVGLADWKRNPKLITRLIDGELVKTRQLDALGRPYRHELACHVLDLDRFKLEHPDRFAG